MDLALGGQGAPIVPGGERLLFPDYGLFLNLGGIANISGRVEPGRSAHDSPEPGGADKRPIPPAPSGAFAAFDVCPANRVLDLLAALEGRPFDQEGSLAATGRVDGDLLRRLNALPYYGQVYPKSLANDFGTDTIFPMIRTAGLSTADALRTYVEHIAVQVAHAVTLLHPPVGGAPEFPVEDGPRTGPPQEPPALLLLLTGGGAHNSFLVDQLREGLQPLRVEIVVPDKALIDHKEALVMALLGVLRWREENNVLASVTGARRDSIGGAVWIGQEI
jgi:anhydro-N-acetylmuramic acid kinase